MPHPTLPDDARIEAELLRLCAARGPDRSFCPSEAARALLPDGAEDAPQASGAPRWQSLMGPVRRVAFALSGRGVIEVLRKGRVVAPEAARGVIRLRAAPLSRDPGAENREAREIGTHKAGPHEAEAPPGARNAVNRAGNGSGPDVSGRIPEA